MYETHHRETHCTATKPTSGHHHLYLELVSPPYRLRTTDFHSNRPRRKEVLWGESSMIEAKRLLFEAALQDPANQRFVLLSDSFPDEQKGHYCPEMSPIIPEEKWRKGSQWITLVRRHAELVIDDEIILPLFKKFCKGNRVFKEGKFELGFNHFSYMKLFALISPN